MRSARAKTAGNVLYALIAVALVLAIWAIAAAAVGTELILPGIGDTVKALGGVLTSKAFYSGLGGTLLRTAISYAISAAVTAAVFFVCTAYEGAARVIRPVVSVLRTLPTMAVSLILAIWAGAFLAPVILGVTVIFPMLYSEASSRVAAAPSELKEIARLSGANKRQMFAAVWFPCAAAGLPESMAAALAFNIKLVIAAEILMQTAGSLGMLMQLAQIYYNTSRLIAYVLAAVVVSVAAECALRAVLGVFLKRYADR